MNGQAAVEAVVAKQRSGSAYNFIFLDLNMPVLNGFEAAKRLRAMDARGTISLSGTQIVAISAITRNQFSNNTEYSVYFDHFSKTLYYHVIIYTFYSGKTNRLHRVESLYRSTFSLRFMIANCYILHVLINLYEFFIYNDH